MRNLVVDCYNVYKRSFDKKGNVRGFFKIIDAIRKANRIKYVFYAFDGNNLHKKSIDESYKNNRKEHSNNLDIKKIKRIVSNLPNSYLIEDPRLEADDIAYSICKEMDDTLCVSEDVDWLVNLLANSKIRVLRKHKIVHELNFQRKLGFPMDKIALFLFLKGDSKDGVKKPFRLKGSVLDNVNKYDSVKDYCFNNALGLPEISNYLKLIAPIDYIPFGVMKGERTDLTRKLLIESKVSFMDKVVV